MARTPGQRGRIGQWLLESRLARGYETQARARSEIQRLTGWVIPQSVYAEWESGRRAPSEANLERLEGFYGQQLEPVQTTATSDTAAILAAMQAQTAAINGLADAVRQLAVASIGGQDALQHELLRVLGAGYPIRPGHGGEGAQAAVHERPTPEGAER